MTLYKREGTKNWWIRIERGGHIYQKTSGTPVKKKAKDAEAALRVEIGSAIPEGSKPTNLANLTSLLYPFWTRSTKPRTAGFYKDAYVHLLEFEPIAKAKLHEIDALLVERFVQHRIAEKGSITRINASIRTLRRALHLAAKWRLITAAPRLILAGADPQRSYVLSEKDFQRLLKACGREAYTVGSVNVAADDGTMMRALLTVLYDCGLRAGEAAALEWRDVNSKERWIHIREGKTKMAKRRVPMTTRVVEAVQSIRPKEPSPETPVFHRRGRALAVSAISHEFTRVRRKIKLDESCVLHSLRHSFATRLGDKGANVLDLQRVCGWSSPVIASRYVHLSDERLSDLSKLLEL